ncbi:DUF2207 domain-containing protein [Aerococcus sp. UMB10185]|uniref:DUF2207 family protein n=1 Tax=unclassified Aerococcus TaxID=2618060 RepID=UPI0008A61BDB|nr:MULTISPECIES: DUF2207 domain-containing protein [unclassified Aerococcus]MDK6232805.1 DUF2207 domain-containing protein [Aerococcus sp. UMB10185]MDK6854904.1 DUF2207 domain-containing protein [Aerococcus sp. UMB7533]MDK8501829.1 DUF2207 domain-containing protein [Aerococcus sp. UMB1112A]OFN02664.1 hypothetical protein HMPREF2626_01765 [Aerococcus sp. HMSC062A02]OHO45501.1 hypothetical protein HMPREF2705_05035 [Aerococcus sp. HMSC035B07]
MVKPGHQRFLLFLVSLILTVMVLPGEIVWANENKGIQVDVTLQPDGSARIREVWDMVVDEGTELYKPMTMLDDQELVDYQVKVDGQPLTYQENWDVEGSQEEKSGHYGRADGELNWGIGAYGPHTYEISYQINNFVAQSQTEQMVFWKLVNDSMSPAPEQIKISLQSDLEPLTLENSYRAWAFGFRGKLSFENGKIIASSQGDFDGSNYATLLLRIPAGTYQTGLKVDKSFEDYLKTAFEGSDYNYEDYDPEATYEDLQTGSLNAKGPSAFDRFMDRHLGKIILAGLALVGVSGAMGAYHIYKQRKLKARYYPTMAQAEERLEGHYHRETPAEDVYQIYALLEDMEVEDLKANYLTVALLDLVASGALLIETNLESGLFRSKEESLFSLVADQTPSGPAGSIYQLMAKAQGKRDQLSQSEFSHYVENNPEKFIQALAKMKTHSKSYLKEAGYLKSLRAKAAKEKTERDQADDLVDLPLTDQGFVFRDQVVGFKNYLADYSLLNERGAKEVGLWDQMMLYAGAYGILEEVEKEFEKVYPNYYQYSSFNQVPLMNYYWISRSINQSYVKATSMSEVSSSGGGGFTSIGGGGGSFGGGSGGGVR